MWELVLLLGLVYLVLSALVVLALCRAAADPNVAECEEENSDRETYSRRFADKRTMAE